MATVERKVILQIRTECYTSNPKAMRPIVVFEDYSRDRSRAKGDEDGAVPVAKRGNQQFSARLHGGIG